MISGGNDDSFTPRDALAAPWRIVERARLSSVLSRSLDRYKISMIAAPSGFGKSTLIDQVTRSAGKSVVRFDSRRRVGGQTELLDGMLAQIASASQPGSYELVSRGAAFERVRLALETFDGIVVVDSLHGDSSFVEGLAELIAGAGEATRWIVATRGGSQLPVATWAAYGVLGCVIEGDDLRFTRAEAGAVAGDIAEPLAERAYLESNGWPAAFRLVIQGGYQTARDGPFAGAAPVMVADYIDQQVLGELVPEQLNLLSDLTLYQGMDRTALATRWPKTDAVVEKIARATMLVRIADSKLHIEHAVAVAIWSRLQQRETYLPLVIKVARSLERVGDVPSALGMYMRADDRVGITRLLLGHALELLDRGHVGLVREALARIKDRARKSERGLKAALSEIAALDGDFALADRYMRDALSYPASDDAKAQLVLRFAVGSIARPKKARREALSSLLREIDALRRSSSAGGPLSRLLDTCSAMARAVVEGIALDLPPGASAFDFTPCMRERLHLAGASILMAQGDWARCASLLRVVMLECAANGHHRLHALAHYLSFKSDVALRGNVARAHAIGRDMLDASEAAGDFALGAKAQAYLLSAALLSGDDAEFVRIRKGLQDDSRAAELNAGRITVCDALKLAAGGSFDAAYARAVVVSSEDPHFSSQAMINALLGLLAAAAGKRDASLLHLDRVARAASAAGEPYKVAADCLNAMSLVLIGRGSSAGVEIARLERMLGSYGPRDLALVKVTRAIFLEHEAGIGLDSAMLAELLNGELEFVRSIVVHLAVSGHKSSSRMASLTRAEVGVLRELASGGTNAVVASRLGRSVNTVNVHVSAILKKLNCASRHEAITVAKNLGLVTIAT